MPALASPNMPPWAQRAHAALGTRPGLAALAVLASQDAPMPSKAVEIATGLNAETTSAALQRLEEAGLVVGSVPPPRPRGTRVTWTMNRDAVAALVHDLDAGLNPPAARS